MNVTLSKLIYDAGAVVMIFCNCIIGVVWHMLAKTCKIAWQHVAKINVDHRMANIIKRIADGLVSSRLSSKNVIRWIGF